MKEPKGWCDGWTPLHLAAKAYGLDIMRMLIERGADVNAKNALRWTPLDVAVRNSNKSRLASARIALLRESGGLTGM